MSTAEQNRLMYIIWLKNEYPNVYAAAMTNAMAVSPPENDAPDSGLSGIGGWADTFSSFLTNVKDIATTYITSKTEIQLLTMNTDRINRGQAPLTASGSTMTVAQMRAAGYSDTVISQIEAKLVSASPISSAGVAGVPWWAVGLAGAGLLAVLLRRK